MYYFNDLNFVTKKQILELNLHSLTTFLVKIRLIIVSVQIDHAHEFIILLKKKMTKIKTI